MIEYYKTCGYIFKIEGNKVYQYSGYTRIWFTCHYDNKQEFLEWYNPSPLTLLDLEMMGVKYD